MSAEVLAEPDHCSPGPLELGEAALMHLAMEHKQLRGLSDAELVLRLKQGKAQALDVLLDRHSEALYRFCDRLAPSREDAEDICQEAMARAITRVDSLQTDGAFRGWLFSIARNLAMDSYRSKRRVCPLSDEEQGALCEADENPEERIEVREERQTVAEAMGKLAQSHQRVLMLREVEGLSYTEIASELDVSHSAVETLLFRARRRLREEYSKTSAVPGGIVIAAFRSLAGRLAPIGAGSLVKGSLLTALVVGGVVGAPRVVVTNHNSPKSSVLHRPLSGAQLTGMLISGHSHARELGSGKSTFGARPSTAVRASSARPLRRNTRSMSKTVHGPSVARTSHIKWVRAHRSLRPISGFASRTASSSVRSATISNHSDARGREPLALSSATNSRGQHRGLVRHQQKLKTFTARGVTGSVPAVAAARKPQTRRWSNGEGTVQRGATSRVSAHRLNGRHAGQTGRSLSPSAGVAPARSRHSGLQQSSTSRHSDSTAAGTTSEGVQGAAITPTAVPTALTASTTVVLPPGQLKKGTRP